MAPAIFSVFPAFANLMLLTLSTARKPMSAQPQGTQKHFSRYPFTTTMEDNMLKGIALWAMGVPIFVIILLYMFVF
ncbi:hypothetical protein [Rhizobium rhizogenes]|uniref:hypothetical protein n=1 Tax=Rhizobium rhizogenes TaxID=359 RepID=UPI0022C9A263|nr:hypothetical protein [Rhizobium rhizogenes]MCZ7479258.1 hypothetical protein [Rhizobium rhizogenes]